MRGPGERIRYLIAFLAGAGLVAFLTVMWARDFTDAFMVAFTGLAALGALASYWAAQRAIHAQQVTSEQMLRAYVLPARGGIRVTGRGIRCEIVITNHGETPALDVAYRMALHQLTSTAQVPSPPLSTRPVDRIGFLGPGHSETLFRDLSGDLPPSAGHHLHAIGEVRYRDIFGAFRTSRFNWLIYTDGSDLHWVSAAEGNELRTEISATSIITGEEAARLLGPRPDLPSEKAGRAKVLADSPGPQPPPTPPITGD